MRFASSEEKEEFQKQNRRQQAEDGDQGFFLTQAQQEDAIKEENESDHENQPQQEQQEEATAEEDEDEFDFGKAKMDFFKKRARDILMAYSEIMYEGVPMPLASAYKNLKHAIKNPTTITNKEQKPGYLKMTFAVSRHAPAAGKFIDQHRQAEISKSMSQLKSSAEAAPILLSLKDKQDPSKNKFLEAVFGEQKQRSKKEVDRDRKVEALLEAYKKQDEELMRKEKEKELTKKLNQKALLEKFGFSDEEEDQNLALALGAH